MLIRMLYCRNYDHYVAKCLFHCSSRDLLKDLKPLDVLLSTKAHGKPHRCLYLVLPLCEKVWL